MTSFAIYSLVDICATRCNVVVEKKEKRSRRQTFNIRDAVDIQACLRFWRAAQLKLNCSGFPHSWFVGVPLYLPTYSLPVRVACVRSVSTLQCLHHRRSFIGFKFRFQISSVSLRDGNEAIELRM